MRNAGRRASKRPKPRSEAAAAAMPVAWWTGCSSDVTNLLRDGPFHFVLSYLDFACSTERMKAPKPATREPWNPPPQPLAGPGEQRPQHFQDEDEADAFSRWLAHVEAGRVG